MNFRIVYSNNNIDSAYTVYSAVCAMYVTIICQNIISFVTSIWMYDIRVVFVIELECMTATIHNVKASLSPFVYQYKWRYCPYLFLFRPHQSVNVCRCYCYILCIASFIFFTHCLSCAHSWFTSSFSISRLCLYTQTWLTRFSSHWNWTWEKQLKTVDIDTWRPHDV